MVPDTASSIRPHLSSRPEKAILCLVCSDKSFGNNFGAITCESCKAFFRRTANERDKLACPFNDNCEITIATRKHCRKCRLEKCFAVGMIKEWIQSEEQLKIRRAILKERKLRREMGANGQAIKRFRSSPSRVPEGIGNDINGNSNSMSFPDKRERNIWTSMAQKMDSSKFHKQLASSLQNSVSNCKGYDSQQSVAQFFNKITDQNFFANLVKSNAFGSGPMRSSISRNSDQPSPNQRSSVIAFTGKSSTSSSPALSVSSSPDQGNQDTCDASIKSMHDDLAPEVDIYPGNFDPDCHPIYQSLVKKKPPVSSCLNTSSSLSSPTFSFTSSTASSPTSTPTFNNLTSKTTSSSPPAFSSETPTTSKDYPLRTPTESSVSNKQLEPFANERSDATDEDIIKINQNPLDLPSESTAKSVSLNVFHHIIDSYFTRINMRSEKISKSYALNSMEESRLIELTLAYGAFNEPLACSCTSVNNLLINCYNVSICQLITMTKKLTAYSELPVEDQITLLRGTFADILAMRGAFLFDSKTCSWPVKGTSWSIKMDQLFSIDEAFYKNYLDFINDLSSNWRSNVIINQLILVIMLFNCNLSGLKSPEAIRLEYCAYIYLLQRYLESSLNFKETPKETLCHILGKINQLQDLNRNLIRLPNGQSIENLKIGSLDSLLLPD